MANWSYLALRAPPPDGTPSSEAEDARVELAGRNILPPFWLALLDEADVRGGWEAGLRAAFADEDEPLPPLVAGWQDARARLAAAVARAPERAAPVAKEFRDWASGLLALAARRPVVDRVEFRLDDYAGFHRPDADAFLEDVLCGIRRWHGAEEPPAFPRLADPAADLGGYGPKFRPFPSVLPEWMPGRTEQRRRDRRRRRRAFGRASVAVAAGLAVAVGVRPYVAAAWDEAAPWLFLLVPLFGAVCIVAGFVRLVVLCVSVVARLRAALRRRYRGPSGPP